MQINHLASKLQSVGLSDKQARVYVATLFMGASPVQKIASQADINRATAYVILRELEDMGLVTESTERKKTVFIAESAESIHRYIESQEKILQTKKLELDNLIPQLNEATRSTKSNDLPIVRFYSGNNEKEDIDKLFLRKTKPNSIIYRMVNIDKIINDHPDFINNDLLMGQNKGLSTKLLYSYSNGEVPSTSKVKLSTKKIDKVVSSDIIIFDSGVIVSDYNNPRSGVIVESSNFTNSIKQLFDLAWNND